MLRSQSLRSNLKLRPRAPRRALWLLVAVAALVASALVPSAFAQADFTLTAAPFSPDAIDPGGNSSSNLTLGTLNGFNSTVSLSCAVTPTQTTGTPVCQVSPETVSPPSGAVVTVTTAGGTVVPGLYTVTITGTGPSTNHTAQQNLTVLAVTPQFTVTVAAAVSPSSVHAGTGGQGMVSVNAINGYAGTVTLSCLTVTPLVTFPPVCSFQPSQVVVSGTTVTSALSISTTGPITQRIAPRATLYALWLPLPLLALSGLGAAFGGKRSRRAWSLLGLFVLAGSILLLPACANNNVTNTTNITGITPSNTYTFTIGGIDSNGNVSSNSSAGAAPTVTLTVD
jgi:hypothetical protein